MEEILESFLESNPGPCIRCPPIHFSSHSQIHREFNKFRFMMQILSDRKENIGPKLFKRIIRQGASLAVSFHSCHTDFDYWIYLTKIEELNNIFDLLYSGRMSRDTWKSSISFSKQTFEKLAQTYGLARIQKQTLSTKILNKKLSSRAGEAPYLQYKLELQNNLINSHSD